MATPSLDELRAAGDDAVKDRMASRTRAGAGTKTSKAKDKGPRPTPAKFRGGKNTTPGMVTLMHYKGRFRRRTDTLLCFVEAMVGKRVEMELRGDVLVKGRLESVDAVMNCRMQRVRWRKGKTTKQLENMYIPGRQITYINIPDEVDITKTLDRHFTEKINNNNRSRETQKIVKKYGARDRKSNPAV
mmetsp:Transcript_12776/g.23213  ORF Transcript_12776/g.23213 Transcript_12776/m.23213 type:complete len:187 (-) Transcript_12776:40-600(-)|eukprot:CAMPEP_0197520050 /NCGR_PEP_ID=MMETSP1318-20131121/5352_1 /TAXON_ID=552666 /ORGANISM="Partenskyella glossopodia, Strain RCC365" /LENGTH=186 /DNA_ID=CAMNT_0043071395 /DNA_START=111 /DNA_END=671 /DNA_ORIENTATION=-